MDHKQPMDDNTNIHSHQLLREIEKALRNISYGSLEIVVQNGVVTQMTVRHITKTSLEVGAKSDNMHTHANNTRQTTKQTISNSLEIKLTT